MNEPPDVIKKLRRRKEQHLQRSKAYRIAFGVAAVLVILAGLALIPLPGPGWLIVAVGLGMLALEFDRAERLLEAIVGRIDATTDRLSPLQKGLLIAAGVAGLAGWVTATILWEIPYFPG